MGEWQLIETAPKDGTHILAYDPGFNDGIIYVMKWDKPLDKEVPWLSPNYKGSWIEASGEQYQDFQPTHWMPLPEIPK